MSVKKRTIVVHSHQLHVPISKKNPSGLTIRDQHIRRLPGTYLDAAGIKLIFKNYDRNNIQWPTKGKLKLSKNSDKYDELIAVWTDYFNKKYSTEKQMDPDVIKALIASESSFVEDPTPRKIAIGITQITKSTLKIIQDPNGESKDFIFSKITQKDLRDPNIAIPLGVRWLIYKKTLARYKLKREPTAEEIILEYKGLLKSTTEYKNKALKNFKENYGLLKSK